MINLEAERAQLVDTWKSAFGTGWIDKPRSCVTALSSPSVERFGDHFRQVHNIFGWMAGNTLEKRGLCSGAIYRSEAFMELAQNERNGAAGPRKTLRHLKNVHIEHTVPVAELAKRWSVYRMSADRDLADAYAWTLVHSVASAINMSEEGRLHSYESRTDAFDPASPSFGLPFMRYTHMRTPITIWNVLTGKKIDFHEWTFSDHFAMVDILLSEASADIAMASAIRHKAKDMLRGLSVPVPTEALPIHDLARLSVAA